MTRRIHRGKGGGAREARKREGVRGPPLPFPNCVGHAGDVVKATFKCSTLSILPNLVVIADMVLKRKLSQTFSIITVQVRIFTSLDRNDLMLVIQNFRDTSPYKCQSLIFSHLASFVLHPPFCMRHIMWSYTKSYALSLGYRELNSAPHGPSKKNATENLTCGPKAYALSLSTHKKKRK